MAVSRRVVVKWMEKVKTSSQVAMLIRAENDVEKYEMLFDSATADNAEVLAERMKEKMCGVNEHLVLMICRAYGRVHKSLEAEIVFQKIEEFEIVASDKIGLEQLSCFAHGFTITLVGKDERHQLKSKNQPVGNRWAK